MRLAHLADRANNLLRRNEPQHKNFDSNIDGHPNRCSSPMFSKETPCKLFNSATSYSVKPANVPSESAKPVWLGVASERRARDASQRQSFRSERERDSRSI